MELFLEALNRPAEAMKRQNGRLSWTLAIITVLIVAVFDPLLALAVNGAKFEIQLDVLRMCWLFGAGIGTYLLVCLAFWLICRMVGSKAAFSAYVRTWGITYIPTMICAVAVSLAETFFTVFWNGSIWGVMLGIVFIAILIWKLILYVLFLRETAGLAGKRLAAAFFLCGIAILLLAWANMFIGLKTPIL